MNTARTALIAWTSCVLACAPPPTPDGSVPEGVADDSPQALVEWTPGEESTERE